MVQLKLLIRNLKMLKNEKDLYAGTNIKGILFILLTVILSDATGTGIIPAGITSPICSILLPMKHYSKNPNFENGMTMRVPVPGTVPRGFIPFNIPLIRNRE